MRRSALSLKTGIGAIYHRGGWVANEDVVFVVHGVEVEGGVDLLACGEFAGFAAMPAVRARVGMSRPMRNATIAITTRSSIRVKVRERRARGSGWRRRPGGVLLESRSGRRRCGGSGASREAGLDADSGAFTGPETLAEKCCIRMISGTLNDMRGRFAGGSVSGAYE